jgi:hypothetical protein
MKPDDPLANGLHRIMISVEDAPGGDSGLSVRAFQHLLDEIEKDDVDPWFISSRVIGLDCETYNFEDELWEDEWEDTNAVPSLVSITVFLEPLERGEDPVEIRRVIKIPVGPAVTGAVSVVTGREGEQAQGDPNAPEAQPQPQGADANQPEAGRANRAGRGDAM